VHAVLRGYGVRLEPAGSGARVVGPEHGQRVKASDIGLDVRGLEGRLGAFKASERDEQARQRRADFAAVSLRRSATWGGLHRELETIGFARAPSRSCWRFLRPDAIGSTRAAC